MFVYNSFPVIRTTIAKNRHFYVPRPSFFVSPGDAPAAITQNVAWMKRQFSACQTPRNMYLSIFNSFRVIRCLSQWVSPKIAILPHFCFPWGRPWGNHAKNVVWMEREFDAYKLSRCVCPSNYNRFWDRARYWSKIIFSYPLAFDAPLGGSRRNCATPFGMKKARMAWLPDGEKISKIFLFVLAQLTNVTDRRTDRRTPHAGNSRAMHSIARQKVQFIWDTEYVR